MSLIKRAGDLIYTFRFLKLLVTKFENTEAYKLGIIDATGKRDKSVAIDSPEKASSYTPFHKLVFNIKKALAKLPGGSSTLASYAAALYLLKEQYGVSEENIIRGVNQLGFSEDIFMVEGSKWFVLKDSRLTPGTYKVKNVKNVNRTMDELVNPYDFISIGEECYPVGSIFGINIYEATHVKSRQRVYVTVDELLA